MKRVLCFIIALLMLPTTAFAQISPWATDSIAEAEKIGIIPEGLSDDWQKDITRGEFASLAVNFMAYNLDYEKDAFAEYVHSQKLMVGEDEEYYFTRMKKAEKFAFADCDNADVLLAAEMGIVKGMGGGNFEPERSITREEAALMLGRIFYLCTNTIAYPSTAPEDIEAVSPWAKKAVQIMFKKGIMQGVGENVFAPKGTYTREMAVVTFVRLADLKMTNGLYKIRPTLERIIASYENSPILFVKETITTDYGTLLVIGSGGAMHTGGQSLVFVTNECKEINFSKDVPYDTPWGQAHYETMELSEDGTKLIYTYSFEDEATYSIDPKNPEVPVRVLHKKGNYVFTADIITGEVTYVFTEAE